jgi:energy-coupling factor transporter transmembrane protein EcfT
MGELTAIGFIPGHSVLHQLDPRTKQILIMGLSGLSLWGSPAFLATLSVVIAALIYNTHIRVGRLIQEIRYFLVFLLFVFSARALVFDGGWIPAYSNPNVAKAGGSQSQGAKGEAVALYCDPLATPDLASSGFPGRVKK